MARRLAQLTQGQAARTLAHRLAPRVDRLRQIATDLGIRPYSVNLVWGRWSGRRERGEGRFEVIRSVALLPNPLVEDLSALALDPRSAGVLPSGSVRLSEISATYSADLLRGLWEPTQPSDRLPPDVGFFYELVEDGRDRGDPAEGLAPGDCGGACEKVYGAHPAGGGAAASGVEVPNLPPIAQRFRPASEPMRRPGKVDWTILLERVSEDRDREGHEQVGPNRGLR